MIRHQRFHYMLHKDDNPLKQTGEDYIINAKADGEIEGGGTQS